MRTADGHISALGKVFIVVVVLLILQFMALVAIIIGIAISVNQSRENEQHIDCIVASGLEQPPERCADIINNLRDQGILRPPPTVAPHP